MATLAVSIVTSTEKVLPLVKLLEADEKLIEADPAAKTDLMPVHKKIALKTKAIVAISNEVIRDLTFSCIIILSPSKISY